MYSLFTQCLKEEAKAINYAAINLCPKEVDKSLDIIETCLENKSKIVISGVGKSGIIARKMASTFTSVGGLAIYLNPLDALHGDLGVLNKSDIFFLLSNSGETEEMLKIIPHVKKRGVKIISIIGNQDSTIGKISDVVLEAKIDKEVCPLNLAPTTSTTVAMAIGDAIASVWMSRKGISTEDFALNHPAGSLGKKISLGVTDLMIPRSELHLLSPDDSFTRILNVITQDGIGTACVVDPNERNKIIGIITDGDLRRALEKHRSETWKSLVAYDIMSKQPITVNETILAIDALKIMEGKQNRIVWSLPIIHSTKGTLIGLIRLHHLVQAGLKEVK